MNQTPKHIHPLTLPHTRRIPCALSSCLFTSTCTPLSISFPFLAARGKMSPSTTESHLEPSQSVCSGTTTTCVCSSDDGASYSGADGGGVKFLRKTQSAGLGSTGCQPLSLISGVGDLGRCREGWQETGGEGGLAQDSDVFSLW